MQLIDLSMEVLEIPLRVTFQHASASRAVTETVLVRARTVNAIAGAGEGCPRSYVTGETLEGALAFFASHREAFMRIGNPDELRDWVNSHREEIDRNPAAFCAVELALLDVLAREAGQSLEALLDLPELAGTFRYSAVIGASNNTQFVGQLQQYLQFGFRDFKFKLFGRPDVDQPNLDAIRSVSGLRVRVDANNLWSDAQTASAFIKALDYPFMAVEEPLGARQHEGCREVFRSTGTRIILDESFLHQADFAGLEADPQTWIINLRVSKNGGILRTLALAQRAKELGIPVIVGAQVGETSLLTRAALTVASFCRGNLLAQEGAFGTRLLQYDIAEPVLAFGAAGGLEADSLNCSAMPSVCTTKL